MYEDLKITKTKDFRISYSETKIDQTMSVQHYHDSYEVAFFVKADLEIFIKDMKYTIQDGDLLFVNEYDIHRIIYNTTSQYVRYVINFKKEYILPFLKVLNVDDLLEWFALKSYKKIHLNLKDRVELHSLFDSILKTSNSDPMLTSQTNRAKVISNLLLVLIRINELLNIEKPVQELNSRDKLVKNILEFIDTNYMNNIDLSLLENKFYTDKFYISHIFKQVTGFSVIEYVQYRRVIEAQKLLKDSNQDILDIYLDCGFNSVQHFYRVFKKISKMSPHKYRKLKL
jgi:AraC-like DNA-binding protein